MPVSKYSQKRKAATTTASGKLKKPDVFFCTRCGEVFNKADHRKKFSTVKSSIWESNDYKLPICNDCLKFYYDFYLRALGDPHSAYRRICLMFNIYYSDAIVDSILQTEQSPDRIGAYISQLNYARYQDKTYDNTIEEDGGKYIYGDCVYNTVDEDGNKINIKAEYEKLKNKLDQNGMSVNDMDEDPEYVEIFGEETGFKLREQKTMVKYYKEQAELIPVQLATSLDETIKNLAKFKMLQGRAIAQNDTQAINSYSKQFNDARKYIDSTVEKFKKNAAADEGSTIIGTVTELIENFCPADIWKKPDAFADVDELDNNVRTKVVRCVKNFFTGSREPDPTYKLPD